eukprot:3240980-Prymnesium_polylepis.1
MRLLKRMKEPQYSEPTIAWEADDEHSGVIKFKPGGCVKKSSLLIKAPAAGSSSAAGCSSSPPLALQE